MKKSLRTIRSLTVCLLALLLSLSLVACSAADGAADGKNYAPGNNYNENSMSNGEVVTQDKSEENQGGIYDNENPVIENKFISTADEPVSTFSADVDTASYTYFRKLVSSGYSLDDLIRFGGASLRTEEMINYFDYNYTAPADGELFGLTTEAAVCPWNPDAVLLKLGFKATEAVAAKGNNLVFLIDVSGSMSSADKLPLLKTAFTYLAEGLGEDDTVSIVTYSGREEVVLEGCSGAKTEKILKAVRSLSASGSTNGQAGIEKAYEIAKRYYIEGGNNRIIMASDGDLNVGISDPERLRNFISEKRDAGIYLSVLGFGTGNYRDANMEALADNGNGIYYYIDGEAEAEKVLGGELTSTLYTIAEDVKLQLTFEPHYVEAYRLVGYENRLLNKEDFEDDTKDAGEVGASHSFTVCYELKLADTSAMSPDCTWMKLAVRYKNPGETESLLNEYYLGSSMFTTEPSADFQFICAVSETAMLLHQSRNLGDIKLNDILGTLNRLDLGGDVYKAEFRDMIRSLAQ